MQPQPPSPSTTFGFLKKKLKKYGFVVFLLLAVLILLGILAYMNVQSQYLFNPTTR